MLIATLSGTEDSCPKVIAIYSEKDLAVANLCEILIANLFMSKMDWTQVMPITLTLPLPINMKSIRSTTKISPKEIGNRGTFPSNKTGDGIVEYESYLERDFFLLCNHAPGGIKFH